MSNHEDEVDDDDNNYQPDEDQAKDAMRCNVKMKRNA